MEGFSSYTVIIAASLIVIVSFFFSVFARKTNIPSVLLLISLGIGINQGMIALHLQELNLFPILEVIGIVGLIMIVLEAALDLELNADKWTIIYKAFLVALLALATNVFAVAFIIEWFTKINFTSSIIYAIPISIMSSAIIIPSIVNVSEHKKEFLIYESTFSDILGIMAFYFVLGGLEADTGSQVAWDVSSNIILTVVISVVVSYLLIVVFQKLKSGTKLFLLIAVLTTLYSVGKLFHLSSLLIILVFGLFLRNPHVFFRGRLARFYNHEAFKSVLSNFYLITIESSFVVRTFFFVIFGMTISLQSLWDVDVLIISMSILAALYIGRGIFIKLFLRNNIFPEIFIAPRGLITILLFFSIPEYYLSEAFDSGILLFCIIFTSVIMAISLVIDANRSVKKRAIKDSLLVRNIFSEKYVNK